MANPDKRRVLLVSDLSRNIKEYAGNQQRHQDNNQEQVSPVVLEEAAFHPTSTALNPQSTGHQVYCELMHILPRIANICTGGIEYHRLKNEKV